MAKVLTSTKGLTHEEWLEYRRMGIGGSDASVVCGVNKYKSLIELWQEKTGQAPHQDAGEAAYWGTRLESMIRDEFTQQTGIEVITVNKILQSKEYPFMLANLDGVCRHPTYGPCIFEAKTASAYKSGEWEDDSVPQEYVLQIQHYMSVTGYAGAYVAVLIGGNTFKWTFVERDDEIITMLIRHERDFWNHIQDDVPPPPDGSDACAKFLFVRYPNSIPGSKIELPVTAVALIRQHSAACEELERATEDKKRAENILKEMLSTNEIGTIAGDNALSWKTVTQERFDSKALKDEQPTLYSKYITKSSYRRFIIKSASVVSVDTTIRKAG